MNQTMSVLDPRIWEELEWHVLFSDILSSLSGDYWDYVNPENSKGNKEKM